MAQKFTNQSPILDIPAAKTENPIDENGWDRTSSDNQKIARDWKSQIEITERRNSVWEKRCERIIKRYRDERMGTYTSTGGDGADSTRRMNILWSNVQVLKPSIYGREPLPIAERRFLDRDPTGRVASQMLERSLRYEITGCGFHDTVNQCVEDWLLVGRGTAWLRYKPMFGPASSLTDRGSDQIDPTGDTPYDEDVEDNAEEDDENLSDASAQEIKEKLIGSTMEVDYVHWKDFMHSKARFWKENEWVCRRVYMSRQDCVDAFGEIVGKEIPLEMTPETEPGQIGNRTNRAVPEEAKKAIVYEIWFKPKRRVYFIAKGYDYLLEEPREDPLGLEGFWPCPKPLFATMTNDTLEPVPDFIEYQDQALEIDNLTNRIDNLLKALKVAGVYNGAEKELERLLDEGHENKLIPLKNWAAFAEKGGIANAISFLPIKEIAEVTMRLFEARDKIKNDLYEITGIADIMRGQADPRETASAINTKGRWGSLRLQQRQAEVARFCRDIVKMMGEIISDHYPDQSILETSGIMYDEGIGPEPPQPPALSPPPVSPPGGMQGGPPAPPGSAPPGGVPGAAPPQGGQMVPQPPNPMMQIMAYQQAMQQWQQQKMSVITDAITLLRNDKLRGFRVDIETDSTINDNAREEKQERVEFIKALAQFIEQAMMAGQQMPDMIPMLGKSILFTVRGFRVGRDLESSIEEFIDKMEADAKKAQGQPKPPSPEQIKANADMAMAQAGIQSAQLKLQGDQARSQAEIQSNQLEAQATQQQMQMKQEMMQMEFQIKQLEAQIKQRELEHKISYSQIEHDHKIKQLQLDHQNKLAQNIADSHSRNVETQARLEEARIAAKVNEHKATLETLSSTHQAKLKNHDAKLKMRDKYPDDNMPAVPEVPEPPEFPESSTLVPPIRGARLAPDKNWYIQHPNTGKYFRVEKEEETKKRVADEKAAEAKRQADEEKESLRKEKEEHYKKILDLVDKLHNVSQHMSSPRKILRDKKGLIIGIE